MTIQQFYPIGTPGKPRTRTEKQIWQQRQTRVRSYKMMSSTRFRRLLSAMTSFSMASCNMVMMSIL